MEELDLSLEDWGEVPRDLHFQDHDCRTANPLLSAATRFWRACIGPHRNYNCGNTINNPKQSGSNDISKKFGTYQLDLGDEPHTDQTGVGKNESKKQEEAFQNRERHEQGEQLVQLEQRQKPPQVVEESNKTDDGNDWSVGSAIISPTELGLPDALKEEAELDLYIRSFQSKFANQYALSLPGHTYEDSVLVGFLGGLLQTVSNDCPYTTVVDIFRAMHQQYSNTRFGEGSAHMKVIRKYWEPFILQLLQCPGPRPSSSGKWAANDACRILVENYVTHSLWYAYWKHREHVKPFNDWKGARQALLQTTAGILEEYSWEKWDKMNAMRDRFLVHWSTIQGKLQDSATVSDKIKRVFTSSHITWKCALEAVQDIRLGQIPTARKSAAALVLAASIDTMHNRDYDSTPTSRFYEAVAQWVGQDGGEIGYFIDLCWPSWREHCRETGFCSSEGPAAFPKQIRMLNSLFSSAESIDEFRTTRRILEKFMDEDGFVVLSYDLSVEAAATTLIFDNNLLVDVPGVFRPMGVTENRFSLEPGIHLIADWVDGAIIISGIIVHFLLEIHIPGLKPLFPLLLLSVVQLDRASQFAETLQDTALDSSYGFVRGDAFRKVIDGVRNGLYRTFEDVRMDLIRMVPIDAIETVLRFCANCASHLYNMGLLTCAHESKRVLRDNYRMSVDMSGDPRLDIEMSPTFLLTDSPDRQEAQNGTSASLSSGLQTASQCSSNSRAIAIEATPAQSAQTYKHRCRKNRCKKVFPTSSNRRRHEKSVHGGKTACSYCLKPIGGRADYKNKHARACKALPREVF